MKQEIMIDGIPVSYSLNARNIMLSVLGKVVIYKIPTFEDLQRIVYLGLTNNHGYTFSEFHDSYGRNIYFSKDKNHYFFRQIRALVTKRIHEINREYTMTHDGNVRHR